jgi:hypothetical protein
VRRGWTGEAVITLEHPAAPSGQPILLIDGEPVPVAEAHSADYKILDATPVELELLYRGGYRFNVEVA